MKTFHDWYLLAKQYYESHGDLKVPRDYITPDGDRLGRWVSRVRGGYYRRLSPEQTRKMDEIGMVWKVKPAEDYAIENCRTRQDFERHRELYLLGAFEDVPLYDAVIDLYSESTSQYSIAQKFGVRTSTVRKILITAGLYTSKRQREVQKLYDQGLTIEEIGEKLKLSSSIVSSYLPLSAPLAKSTAYQAKAVEVSVPSESETITEELIHNVAEDYLSNIPIQTLAETYGFNKRKIRKMLITAGVYSSQRTEEIAELHQRGKTSEEIAAILGITIPAVNGYLPYERAAYNTGAKNSNSTAGKNKRKRKKAKDELLASKGSRNYRDLVWRNILLFEGSQVKQDGYNEYYKVKGDALKFKGGFFITRNEIEDALNSGEYSPLLRGLFELIGAAEPPAESMEENPSE